MDEPELNEPELVEPELPETVETIQSAPAKAKQTRSVAPKPKTNKKTTKAKDKPHLK